MSNSKGTLYPLFEPGNIPENAQWLSGQGAGVWFYIENTSNLKEYRIQRFSSEGEVDCDRLFTQETDDIPFDSELPHKFKYISHCDACIIEQGNTIFTFKYMSKS